MSARWPRNVIVVKREPAPIAPRCESLLIRQEHRSVATLRLRSGVSLRVFTEREGEGS